MGLILGDTCIVRTYRTMALVRKKETELPKFEVFDVNRIKGVLFSELQ